MGGTGRRRGQDADASRRPRPPARAPTRAQVEAEAWARAQAEARARAGLPVRSRPPYAQLPPPSPSRDMLSSGSESPGLGERWYGLSSRRRRTAVAIACLALAAGGGWALATQPSAGWWQTEQRPQPQQETESPPAASRRMPYPAQTARITFDGLTLTDQARRTFTVRMRAAATSPLTVLKVGQGYDAVELGLAGRPPVTVVPGSPRNLFLEGRVTNCDRVPLRARSPFLNVTLRNDRARQELSVIPGERYADALTHAFRTLCGLDAAQTPSQP